VSWAQSKSRLPDPSLVQLCEVVLRQHAELALNANISVLDMAAVMHFRKAGKTQQQQQQQPPSIHEFYTSMFVVNVSHRPPPG
jgi:hypothetical protein